MKVLVNPTHEFCDMMKKVEGLKNIKNNLQLIDAAEDQAVWECNEYGLTILKANFNAKHWKITVL